jgi:predicted nucleic acid-binding protein
MIFVDSNIPMYLVGAEHPNKIGAQQLLEWAIHARERLVTDVEVLQEILHRYVAIHRRKAIQPAFDAILNVVDEVFPILLGDAERAKEIVSETELSARDALHLAVMERENVVQIMSFDTDFDLFKGVSRLRVAPNEDSTPAT